MSKLAISPTKPDKKPIHYCYRSVLTRNTKKFDTHTKTAASTFDWFFSGKCNPLTQASPRNNNKYLELFWVQADTAISEASITTSLECQEGIRIQKGIFGRNAYYFSNCFEYPVSMVKMAFFRPKHYKYNHIVVHQIVRFLWQFLEFCKKYILLQNISIQIRRWRGDLPKV